MRPLTPPPAYSMYALENVEPSLRYVYSHYVLFLSTYQQLSLYSCVKFVFFTSACHAACASGCEGPDNTDCDDCTDGWDEQEEGCFGKHLLFHQNSFVIPTFLGGLHGNNPTIGLINYIIIYPHLCQSICQSIFCFPNEKMLWYIKF